MMNAIENMNARQSFVADVIEDFIEAFELDYGNAEIDELSQDRITFIFEAPNHTTLSVDSWNSQYANSQIKEAVNAKDVNKLQKVIAKLIWIEIEQFDPEDTFDEIWSTEFEYGAFEFVDMLKEDSEYFEQIEDELHTKYLQPNFV